MEPQHHCYRRCPLGRLEVAKLSDSSEHCGLVSCDGELCDSRSISKPRTNSEIRGWNSKAVLHVEAEGQLQVYRRQCGL